MDSRIDPLGMLGLRHGDAKIFRNPGGRVTPQALEALVLGVHLLNVERILVVPHTRCAMASIVEQELREQGRRVRRRRRHLAASFGVVTDQLDAAAAGRRARCARTRSSPSAPRSAASCTTSTRGCSPSTSERLTGVVQRSPADRGSLTTVLPERLLAPVEQRDELGDLAVGGGVARERRQVHQRARTSGG